jgi:hypothetical protein
MYSPERRAYYFGLQNINGIDLNRHTNDAVRKFSDENYEKPPQTLKDIFKISNRNRKKNK